MAQRRRSGAKGGVDWFCPGSDVASAIGAVAAGAQFVISDDALVDANSGQAFDAGAVVGLRAWLRVYTGASIGGQPPAFVGMILPVGLGVPTVSTHAQRKANERYIWFKGAMKHSAIDGVSAITVFQHDLELRSARRFNTNDRLVIVGVNRSGGAYNAGATAWAEIDAYVRED